MSSNGQGRIAFNPGVDSGAKSEKHSDSFDMTLMRSCNQGCRWHGRRVVLIRKDAQGIDIDFHLMQSLDGRDITIKCGSLTRTLAIQQTKQAVVGNSRHLIQKVNSSTTRYNLPSLPTTMWVLTSEY